jgi:hypothetical protein
MVMPVTMEARVESQTSLCEAFYEQITNELDHSQSTSVFLCQ